MQKSRTRGWQSVFRFSLMQTLKSKTFILTTVVTAVIMLVLAPVVIYKQGGAATEEKSKLSKLLVVNDTKLKDIDYSELKEYTKGKYEKVEIKESDKDFETSKDDIKDEIVLAHITFKDNMYGAELIKAKETDITDSDILMLSEAMVNCIKENLLTDAKVTKEQREFMDAPVDTAVNVVSINASEEKTDDEGKDAVSSSSPLLGYVFAFALYMLLIMCGENIATSIVTEKASKVLEYMLTSITSFALIIGKALAAITTSFIQIGVIIVSSSLSVFVSKQLGLAGSSEDVFTALKLDNVVNNITPLRTLGAVVILLLGFSVFTMLACLVASMASRIEDIGETNMIYMVLVILGLMLTMPMVMEEASVSKVYANVMLMVPFTSPFVAPTYALNGDMNLMIMFGSILILVVSLLLLSKFVARVYDTLIMYNGNKVRFKQLLTIYKNSKKGGAIHE